MKSNFKLIGTIAIVIILFIGFTTWQKNYDPRYTESSQSTATVLKKRIRPEGMYQTSYVVNNTVRYTETWNPEKSMVTVLLDGKEYETDTDKDFYKTISLDDEVEVFYQEPKYFGDPFNITILNPNNPSQLESLKAMQEAY